MLRHSDVQFLLSARRFLGHDYADKLLAAFPDIATCQPGALRAAQVPFLRAVWFDDASGLGWAAAHGDLLARAWEVSPTLLGLVEAQVAPSDDAVIVYTSGSTALPKAVIHSQWNVTRHPPELAEAFPGQLTVIEGDATKVPHRINGPFHVVANLPYNVGTALFVGWLGGEAWPPPWTSLTLMFQQEVAERIVAAPGGSAFGRLAVLAQWRSAAKIAMKVHRSAFTPPPKVMSAVVHVVPEAMPKGVPARLLERLTEAAFGQRRKMLRQSLKGLPGALAALETLSIDAQRRAETLSVEEFVAIARTIAAAR